MLTWGRLLARAGLRHFKWNKDHQYEFLRMKWGMFEQHGLIITSSKQSRFLMVPHLHDKHHSIASHCIHDPSLSRFLALGWHFLHHRHAMAPKHICHGIHILRLWGMSSLGNLSLLTAY